MPDSPIHARLAEVLPSWLSFPLIKDDEILGYAAPSGTLWARKPLDVTIRAHREGASIRETMPHHLPIWCPELHLNSNRTFCLGLDQLAVVDRKSARQWWADIEVHLQILSVAVRTRVWPQHSALDHGDAGDYHRAARRLADRLGLGEEYARASAGESSWINDDDRRLITDDGLRSDIHRGCPCGCRQKSGRPYKLKSCPRRRDVAQLILLERMRRLALDQFWHEAAKSSQPCCGFIRDCPLMRPAPRPDMTEALRRARVAFRRVMRI